MNRYYRLLLDDYSAASFTSFDKAYFGTFEELDDFFAVLKEDEVTKKHQADILSAYDEYISGNKTVSHKATYRDVSFLVPAKVLGVETSVLTDYSWDHFNAWQCIYKMKCDKVESTHIWVSCRRRYIRCIQAKFTNLQCENILNKYEPLGDMIWGYPRQIVGSNGNLQNRLFVEEKVFKNKAEAYNNRKEFIHSPDPNFSSFLDDIFGDG